MAPRQEGVGEREAGERGGAHHSPKEHLRCGICGAEHLTKGYCRPCYDKKYSQAKKKK